MTFTWLLFTADGSPASDEVTAQFADGNAQHFQADAETWLGEQWPDLVDAGIDSVTLTEDGAEVYGPMSLQQPDS